MVPWLSGFATRFLRVCNGVRSTSCCSGPGIGPRAKFFPRVVEAGKIYSRENTRIQGARPTGKKLFKPYPNLLCEPSGYFRRPSCLVIYERKCTPLSTSLQDWKEDICPKPKPDIFVYSLKDNLPKCLVAYSLEEDGSISPKYCIYPPSFLTKDYFFTRGSCNGLFHFHDRKSGHVLWNPTKSEYKILPKPFVEVSPRHTYVCQAFGMWSDHRFEDYKLLNLVHACLEDEKKNFLGSSYHIDLYSLKTNSWKRIPCPEIVGFDGSTCACISGVFYCKAYLKQSHVILSFDFSTETLSSLPAPNNSWHRYYFLEYKGLLSAFECWNHKVLDYPYLPWKYDVWVMRDGSWTKESIIRTRGVKEPLWCSLDGKLLYFSCLNDELLVCDRDTGKIQYLGVIWSTTNTLTHPMMIPFYESFVPLNSISDVEKMHEKEEKRA